MFRNLFSRTDNFLLFIIFLTFLTSLILTICKCIKKAINLHIVWTAGTNLALPDTLSRNTSPELLTRNTTVEIPQNI